MQPYRQASYTEPTRPKQGRPCHISPTTQCGTALQSSTHRKKARCSASQYLARRSTQTLPTVTRSPPRCTRTLGLVPELTGPDFQGSGRTPQRLESRGGPLPDPD
eukprot:206444-Chlamydomonas_euryale.AAC.1